MGKESTLNPAILIKPEIVLAVTMLPTLELPSLATKSSHPGMKMLSSTLLPPSVPLPSPSMPLNSLSNSTPEVSTLKRTVETVITTWIMLFAVGYGTESEGDYFLVKNSWGTGWGLDGYIKMARNMDNQCGVATECVYPTV